MIFVVMKVNPIIQIALQMHTNWRAWSGAMVFYNWGLQTTAR